jgi:hypothetical protein
MDKRERIDVQSALVDWFSSQQINPLDAALIMSSVIGGIVGRLSRQDLAFRRETLAIMQNEMQNEMNRQANDD